MAERDDPGIDRAQVARFVATASEEELAGALSQHRESILEQVFAQMAAAVRPDARRDADIVVEWRIRQDEGDALDRWQLSVADGEARVVREGDAQPTVALTAAPVDFFRLVTGNADPTRLYLNGRLLIEGDLMTAALLQSYFDVPGQTTTDEHTSTPREEQR